MTSAQRGSSLAIRSAKSCGVEGKAIAPSVDRRSTISGERSALLTAALSRLTTGAKVNVGDKVIVGGRIALQNQDSRFRQR